MLKNLKKDRNKKGLNPVIATLILIAVIVAISVSISFWTSNLASLFAQFVDLHLSYVDIYGPIIKIDISNKGTSSTRLEVCKINDRYRADFLMAYDAHTGTNLLEVDEQGNMGVRLNPGVETVIWLHVPIFFEAGNTIKIECSTSSGFSFTYHKKPYVSFSQTDIIKLVAYTGYSGGENNPKKVIEIDVATWLYNYTLYSQPDPDGERSIIRTYESLSEVLTRLNETYTSQIRPNSPVVIVVNPYAGRSHWTFTWHGPCNGGCTTVAVNMTKINGAIPGLDFLIFWEDLWTQPGYYDPSDCQSWLDHVVRVTWLQSGRIVVSVYHASGGYMHEFWIGNRKYYTKDHGQTINCCECGPSCNGICNSCTTSCTTLSCGYIIQCPCLTIRN